LDRQQILDSIRVAGFSPHRFLPADSFAMFSLTVQCYLRSGIPVILQVSDPRVREYHAVTGVGFRTDSTPLELGAEDPSQPRIRATGMSRIYVHEDRLGPYARMRWLRGEDSDQAPLLQYEPYAAGQDWFPAPMPVSAAIVPLYPKLRLSASRLLSVAAGLYPIFRALVGRGRRDSLSVDCRYVLGGKYLEEIMSQLQPPGRAARIALSLTLPRYIGLIRFMSIGAGICDVICDPTDIARPVPIYGAVLAFVSLEADIVGPLTQYVNERMPHARVE
jgi:hypothetical protein